MPDVARAMRELDKLRIMGPRDRPSMDYIGSAQVKIRENLNPRNGPTKETIDDYDRMFDDLVSRSKANAFRDFLPSAPEKFVRLGERLATPRMSPRSGSSAFLTRSASPAPSRRSTSCGTSKWPRRQLTPRAASPPFRPDGRARRPSPSRRSAAPPGSDAAAIALGITSSGHVRAGETQILGRGRAAAASRAAGPRPAPSAGQAPPRPSRFPDRAPRPAQRPPLDQPQHGARGAFRVVIDRDAAAHGPCLPPVAPPVSHRDADR